MRMIKQKALCDRKYDGMMFAPMDGVTWCCHKELTDTDKEYMTGCPFCNRSWCD